MDDFTVRFIIDNTTPAPVPGVPEILIRTAGSAHELWHRTEAELDAIGLPPPFWAFPWAGGQVLARFLLDHPDTVADRDVIDFASGSGLVGIAAMLAGARSVLCADIDPFAGTAALLNAALNGVTVSVTDEPLLGRAVDKLILAGDVFYDQDLAGAATTWFEDQARRGFTVLAGDPGRHYRPGGAVAMIAEHDMPVIAEIEDGPVKRAAIYRFGPAL